MTTARTTTEATEILESGLVDLIDLTLQGKQLHWNITGPTFLPVHRQLDEVVDDARIWADDIAERIVTIGGVASGQADYVARETSLPPAPPGTIGGEQAVAMMTERLAVVAAKLREAIGRLGDLDLASQDLIIEIVRGLEKHSWMFRVQTK